LPAAVQRFCVDQLFILAEHPTRHSRPSHFPYKTQCQIFDIDCVYRGEHWEVRALFKFGQDEQSIFVLSILFSKTPDAESDEDFPIIEE